MVVAVGTKKHEPRDTVAHKAKCWDKIPTTTAHDVQRAAPTLEMIFLQIWTTPLKQKIIGTSLTHEQSVGIALQHARNNVQTETQRTYHIAYRTHRRHMITSCTQSTLPTRYQPLVRELSLRRGCYFARHRLSANVEMLIAMFLLLEPVHTAVVTLMNSNLQLT